MIKRRRVEPLQIEGEASQSADEWAVRVANEPSQTPDDWIVRASQRQNLFVRASSFLQRGYVLQKEAFVCGGFGCIYIVCKPNDDDECRKVVKVGLIGEEEGAFATKMSEIELGPHVFETFEVPSFIGKETDTGVTQLRDWFKMTAIVMERYDGDLLDYYDRLDHSFSVPAAESVWQLFTRCAEEGVVHGDLKLENILVNRSDPTHVQAVLTDFAHSRIVEPGSMEVAADWLCNVLTYAQGKLYGEQEKIDDAMFESVLRRISMSLNARTARRNFRHELGHLVSLYETELAIKPLDVERYPPAELVRRFNPL